MSERYSERLWVPAWWWIVTTFLVATFWIAFAAALPSPWGHAAGAGTGVVAMAGLIAFGYFTVTGGSHGVTAGKARLPLAAVGTVEVLSATHARVVRGPGADASASFWLRPYVETAVRVFVTDPDDPTPYWYIATRHPDLLAAALERAKVQASTY